MPCTFVYYDLLYFLLQVLPDLVIKLHTLSFVHNDLCYVCVCVDTQQPDEEGVFRTSGCKLKI